MVNGAGWHALRAAEGRGASRRVARPEGRRRAWREPSEIDRLIVNELQRAHHVALNRDSEQRGNFDPAQTINFASSTRSLTTRRP